ncbi:hypothetical protein K438DRAFT_1928130 [Mycena galopus ATCC 62051]|nr:hypothetical protein K438DRAFT_1928130 [Mycena galopus ATCC 62051]
MFGFYVHLLLKQGMAKTPYLSLGTISLFVLCTAHLALLLATTAVVDRTEDVTVIEAGDPGSLVYQLNFATNAIYVTANVIADSIFVRALSLNPFMWSMIFVQIVRCHAIWNYDDRVVFLPILATFGVGGLGYFDSGRSIVVSRPLFNLSIGTSVFTTFMLIGLCAGRIWWLAHNAQKVLGHKITTRYNTACVMILESGALYCVGGIIYIILSLHRPHDEAMISAFARTNGAILGQLVGIAPTIIAVRVGLGKSVESVDSSVAIEQAEQRVNLTARGIQTPVDEAHTIVPQVLDLQLYGDHDEVKARAI